MSFLSMLSNIFGGKSGGAGVMKRSGRGPGRAAGSKPVTGYNGRLFRPFGSGSGLPVKKKTYQFSFRTNKQAEYFVELFDCDPGYFPRKVKGRARVKVRTSPNNGPYLHHVARLVRTGAI
jgi:hypothetical protein